MELRETQAQLIQIILDSANTDDYKLILNKHENKIKACIHGWTIRVPDNFGSYKVREVIQDYFVPIYDVRNDFYYGDYRYLEEDAKEIIELAVNAIKIMNKKSKADSEVIEDKDVEQIEDESTEYIKDNFFKDYTDELAQTLHDKNSDYGDSFSKGMKELGMPYVLSRIFDKFNRIKELSGKNSQLVKDESLKDSVKDLAGYAVLLWKYLEESEEEWCH